MFFAKNEYGSDRLKLAFDSLNIPRADRLKKVAKHLDISERTLSNWLTGKTTPPRAAVFAVWHESPYGLAVTSAHSERAAHLWRSLAKSQEAAINKTKSKIDALQAEIDGLKRAARSSDVFPVAVNDTFFNRY